jgi:hypothetical protein
VSLVAPLSVSVEVRTNDRRVFRLSRNVGDSRLMLERPAPFEIGQPVMISFTLPSAEADGPTATVTLRAAIDLADEDGDRDGDQGGRMLDFVDPPREVRQAIARYVAERLGLPAASAR